MWFTKYNILSRPHLQEPTYHQNARVIHWPYTVAARKTFEVGAICVQQVITRCLAFSCKSPGPSSSCPFVSYFWIKVGALAVGFANSHSTLSVHKRSILSHHFLWQRKNQGAPMPISSMVRKVAVKRSQGQSLVQAVTCGLVPPQPLNHVFPSASVGFCAFPSNPKPIPFYPLHTKSLRSWESSSSLFTTAIFTHLYPMLGNHSWNPATALLTTFLSPVFTYLLT